MRTFKTFSKLGKEENVQNLIKSIHTNPTVDIQNLLLALGNMLELTSSKSNV